MRKRYDRSHLRDVSGQLRTNEVWTVKRESWSIFRIMQLIFDTSAIKQTHGFALFLRCWWMEARDIPAGLRQSVTSLVYKLRTDMLLQNIHIQNLWNLHFRLLSTGVVWPKIIFDLWRRKKRELENNLTIFENRIIKYCRRFLKKSISPVLVGLTSPLKRENSL